ncbi:anti-sigma factor, partial [Klenkia sp. PcliD-1-E]|uniref:anti-sigma factor n=1 Tax=Klenkia sp. PcliD-1-E TaxID=2954492 RepID=UPI0020969517
AATGPPTGGPARRSTRRRWIVVGAVAAGLLVGVAVGAALARGGAGSPVPVPGTAVASAQLDPFGDWDSSGEATLTETDGRWDLQVQLTAPPPAADGFYEVWLLSADGGAQSLGNLEGASGSYVVPEGVDLSAYDTVDVSLEPYDGDPEHSTDSITRGTLG